MIRAHRVLTLLLATVIGALPPMHEAVAASAAEELYQARVVVADTAEATRPEALRRALAQALGKLSGQRAVSASEVEAMPLAVEDLVQEFRYQQRDDAEAAPITELWVRFDAEAMNAAMRQAGIARWIGERPEILVWMAVSDNDDEVRLAGGGDVPRFEAALRRAAWSRGLRLRQPLLDLEDRIKLQPQALWRLERESVINASRRYGPGPVLVVRIESRADVPSASRWRTAFELIDGDADWRIAEQGEAIAPLLEDAMQPLADFILARYQVGSGPSEAIAIVVDDVSTLADYGRVMSYLRGIDALEALAVAETRDAQIVLRMRVRGGLEALSRILSVGGVLIAGERPDRYRLAR